MVARRDKPERERMEKTLNGEVALVTGSGRGLGFAIADRLAELGADVAIHDISQEAAAHFGVSPEAVYATMKAAVVQYSRCLAVETRPHGVRVNVVSPGGTITARFMATRKTDPARVHESVSLARYGKPAEVADVVAFL